ncbi:hypothetical protein GQ457_09G019170 [Hibiscus cannabinus]
MKKMEVADATPIQMAMATPQASEQAEPEVPTGIPRSPAATSQATPAASHTPTPAATPATQDSKQSTPDSPLGQPHTTTIPHLPALKMQHHYISSSSGVSCSGLKLRYFNIWRRQRYSKTP